MKIDSLNKFYDEYIEKSRIFVVNGGKSVIVLKIEHHQKNLVMENVPKIFSHMLTGSKHICKQF